MLVVPFKRQVTVGGGGQTVFSVMKVQGGALTRAAAFEDGPPSANRNRVSWQLGTHSSTPRVLWIPGTGYLTGSPPPSLITASGVLTHLPCFPGAEDGVGRHWTS